MQGSQHNDEFYMEDGAVRTRTNRSGGVQGGISNGEDIVIRVAFKPTSTIGVKQKTVTREGEETELRARGRHDPCVVPRAVPMVESMVALVLADQLLQVGCSCRLSGVPTLTATCLGRLDLLHARADDCFLAARQLLIGWCTHASQPACVSV